ncbi:flagellar basal-body rod protein FlgG [Pseudohalioglobus lutimaris]|uniref:Flagellar basal-body rod protein FlgG n=1 Tax=Pseudohalioglobus lutimaris TaxID=1737061 RepID=A0A2N5X1R4_9GAMM|nr:flagellar basal-body rod protein FlgG [Pseudohalioglobus lutimaris]PLW68418.1 flagellar basal-body rod protein FlgG [Pseudohalioglobus lutimaris]
MNQSLWIAKTGLDAQQTKMSTIANNLANAGTTGYKRGRAVFADLLYQNLRQVGAQSSQDTQLPSGLTVGTGVRTVATEKLFTQGNLQQTDNKLDMAIQGDGFFPILMPDGTEAYTRDGTFQMDAQGQMVTPSGFPLQPAITIPENAVSVTIAGDGTVSARLAGSSQITQIGTIQLSDFVNPAGLQPVGNNLFVESSASGSPQPGNPGLNGLGVVVQGYVETSNVNVVEELVNMIETQRAYEMNSKAISTTDQMLQYLSNNI